MANANENPELEVGFCTDGTVIDIPESLQLLGVTPENPTIHGHVINKLFKMIFENLNHQKKKAISFWEPDEFYVATANNIDICRRNNKIYFCKQTHNDTGTTPKDPATNPDYWTVLYDLDNTLDDKYSLKTHAHNWNQISGKPNLFPPASHTHSEFVPSSYLFAGHSNVVLDPDNIVKNTIGYFRDETMRNDDTFPNNMVDGAVYSQVYSSAYLHQILGDYRTGDLFTRGKNLNTWTPWKKIWSDRNTNTLFSGNGYISLANGLIIQWGKVPANTAVVFPISFPNATLQVLNQIEYPSSGGFAGADVYPQNITNAGFSRPDQAAGCRYIAIGH